MQRLLWLDAMKAIGLFVIVAGHFTPPLYEFLYVFSVQLFFIMSGFLSKRCPFSVFVRKTTRQLVLPMFLLGLMVISINSMRLIARHDFTIGNIWDSLFGLIAGEQLVLGGLWFVYTLIIVKLISQLPSLKIKALISIAFLSCAVLYNLFSDHLIQNCWLNTLLAYPMFFIGELLSKYRQTINSINNRLVLTGLFLVGLSGVAISGIWNSPVWMYRCLYGDNLILFLSGSLSGTLMIFAISKLFFDKPIRIIKTIADGSIIILAFHIQFVLVGLHYPVGYGYYLEAVLIMLLFVPVIRFCQKYFPVLLGFRGIPAMVRSDS